MAIGRILSKQISLSKQVADLSCDLSRLAFTWTIAHLDRDGRIHGEAGVLKSIVFPRRADISEAQMDGYIGEWAAAGLVTLYEIGGERFIEYPEFRKHQPNLRYDREPPSIISPSQAGRKLAGKHPEGIRKVAAEHPPLVAAEVKLREEKLTMTTSPNGDDPELRNEDVPESLKNILAVLKTEYAMGLHVSDLTLLDQLRHKAYPSVVCDQLRAVKKKCVAANKAPPARPIHYVHSYMKDWKKTMSTDDIKKVDRKRDPRCPKCGDRLVGNPDEIQRGEPYRCMSCKADVQQSEVGCEKST